MEDRASALLAFGSSTPTTKRAETDQLLYDTPCRFGIAVNSDKDRTSAEILCCAERLGNLPQEASRPGRLVFHCAVAYWLLAFNWEIAAGYWRDRAASLLQKNACDRLMKPSGHGDQLAYLLDWCPAVSIHQEAWNRQSSENLGASAEYCLAKAAPGHPCAHRHAPVNRDRPPSPTRGRTIGPNGAKPLSDRELDVLQLLAAGERIKPSPMGCPSALYGQNPPRNIFTSS